jgi:eukaryotic translation initiation factor 2C
MPEHIENLSDMVKESLRRFYAINNKTKPARLIFYRDGVSDGQLEAVFRHEVLAIKAACGSLEPGYNVRLYSSISYGKPTLTFILVRKRHHVRLFPGANCPTDRSGNVPPGVVVDTGIVHPRAFDFYLVSHSGIQGTSRYVVSFQPSNSRPTHYHVLHDENAFLSDQLQALTFRLCFNVRQFMCID